MTNKIAARKKAERRQQYRQQVIELLGGKCSICGNDDCRVLQIDHINKDGYLDSNGSKLIAKIVLGQRGIGDLRLLCANCHHRVTYHAEESQQ